MKNYNIKNLAQLQEQRRSLKVDYILKGDYLKNDATAYVKQFSPGNLFKKYATPSVFLKADDKFNISSSVMSLVLPVIMNSTLFRGSGFITKALVGLATSKVGKSLDAEQLTGIFSTVKSFFTGNKKKKDKPVGYIDYGIPPDSETY